MKIKQPCPTCAAQNPYCQVCKGEGFVWIEGRLEKLSSSSCQTCQGKGFIIDKLRMKVCSECKGSGKHNSP